MKFEFEFLEFLEFLGFSVSEQSGQEPVSPRLAKG